MHKNIVIVLISIVVLGTLAVAIGGLFFIAGAPVLLAEGVSIGLAMAWTFGLVKAVIDD